MKLDLQRRPIPHLPGMPSSRKELQMHLFRTLIVATMLLVAGSMAAAAEQTFSIASVGASNSSGTIFIGVGESIVGSSCTNQTTLRVTLDDPIAEELYAAAMTAFVSGFRLWVAFTETSCLSDSPRVQAFRIIR